MFVITPKQCASTWRSRPRSCAQVGVSSRQNKAEENLAVETERCVLHE